MNRFILKRESVKSEEEPHMCRDLVVERRDTSGSVERSREETVDSKVAGDKEGAGDSLVRENKRLPRDQKRYEKFNKQCFGP